MNQYQILKDFCKVRNTNPTYLGSEDPITNRAKFIIDNLPFKPNIDTFEAYDKDLLYANIELSFDVGSKESIVFTSHHDVINVNSDNCLDNSASVANMLAFADACHRSKLNKNIHIVFTDCEEFGARGAQRLSDRINGGEFGEVEYVVNLELTARGTRYLCEGSNSKLSQLLLDDDFVGVAMPHNDSVVLRQNDIDSVCITMIPDTELIQLLGTGVCDTWMLCHQNHDVVENAIEEDMSAFQEYLRNKWIAS